MIAATRSYVAEVWEAWDDFWFTPTSPSTLSAIRVLAGAMLLYTHLVWSLDLDAFFGPQRLAAAAIDAGGARRRQRSRRPGPASRQAATHLDALRLHPVAEADVDRAHRGARRCSSC